MVGLQNIKYVSDLGPRTKMAWVGVEKNKICAVQTEKKQTDMGRVWTKSRIWDTFA